MQTNFLTILLIFLTISWKRFVAADKRRDVTEINDGLLTVPEIIQKYNYSVEVHKVQTSDGFILELHRIPKPGATPALLMHGLLDSSAGWIITGPKHALGYYLSDQGYDVWMGNARGTRYSRNHTKFHPRQSEFWDFSFHEIGVYDVPAMIDYIVNTTNFERIHYIGHSQGTTALFVMCDQRPQHCNKIISVNALAPVAYLKNIKSPLLIGISHIVGLIGFVGHALQMNEFMQNNEHITNAAQALCKEKSQTQGVCQNVLFLLAGFQAEEMNSTMLPVILGHVSAGASLKQIEHFGQLARSEHFRMFDYGLLGNLHVYKNISPKPYNLAKTTVPIALHYALNDWMADITDVDKLADQLPGLIQKYLVPLPEFNHMDFVFGMNTRELVYKKVVRVMKFVERHSQ